MPVKQPVQDDLIGGTETAKLALDGAMLAFCHALNCGPEAMTGHRATAIQRQMPKAYAAMVAVAGPLPWRKPAMATVDESRVDFEAALYLKRQATSMIQMGVRVEKARAAYRALHAICPAG